MNENEKRNCIESLRVLHIILEEEENRVHSTKAQSEVVALR